MMLFNNQYLLYPYNLMQDVLEILIQGNQWINEISWIWRHKLIHFAEHHLPVIMMDNTLYDHWVIFALKMPNGGCWLTKIQIYLLKKWKIAFLKMQPIEVSTQASYSTTNTLMINLQLFLVWEGLQGCFWTAKRTPFIGDFLPSSEFAKKSPSTASSSLHPPLSESSQLTNHRWNFKGISAAIIIPTLWDLLVEVEKCWWILKLLQYVLKPQLKAQFMELIAINKRILRRVEFLH